MASIEWHCHIRGRHEAKVQGKRLLVESSRNPANNVFTYACYVDNRLIGHHTPLTQAKTKTIRAALNKPDAVPEVDYSQLSMPDRATIKARLEAAGYRVTDTNLAKATAAQVCTVEGPTGRSERIPPLKLLKILEKFAPATAQRFAETGFAAPPTVEDHSDDPYGLDLPPTPAAPEAPTDRPRVTHVGEAFDLTPHNGTVHLPVELTVEEDSVSFVIVGKLPRARGASPYAALHDLDEIVQLLRQAAGNPALVRCNTVLPSHIAM